MNDHNIFKDMLSASSEMTGIDEWSKGILHGSRWSSIYGICFWNLYLLEIVHSLKQPCVVGLSIKLNELC